MKGRERFETTHEAGEKGVKGGREGQKKGRFRHSEGGECNRKPLSELPMASSQSVQTLRNSRQRAEREGRCQEGGRQERGGRVALAVCCQRVLLHEKERAHT